MTNKTADILSMITAADTAAKNLGAAVAASGAPLSGNLHRFQLVVGEFRNQLAGIKSQIT
jgi:hypothetical protein